MDMSPHTSLEENAGYSEVCDILRDVLLQHRAGLKVKELREVLKETHQVDLENLRKEMGFGNIISFLAQLPGYQLQHPELHGNCVITHAQKSGCTDPFYTRRSAKQCWYEDSLPDHFLSSTSPPKNHQSSPEKSISQKHKAPTTSGMGCTAVQLESTVSCSTRLPGYHDGPECISPGLYLPDTTSSPDQACSIHQVDTVIRAKALQRLQTTTKRKSSGCTDPFYTRRSEKQCWYEDSLPDHFLSSTSPPEEHRALPKKSISQNHEAPSTTGMGCAAVQLESTVSSSIQHPGYHDGPEGISPGLNLPDTTSSPDQACSIRQVDTVRGAKDLQKLPPKRKSSGMDEEVLSVLTRPKFASGIRLFKLVEILNAELGIDLEELSWSMGYKHSLALLHRVRNVKLIDPSKGQDCVVKFQPGFKGNKRNVFLRRMALPQVATPGPPLEMELRDSPHNYTSHDFLYPVPLNSSKKQAPNSTQNGINNISNNLPKVGSVYPSLNKSKGASITVYASKYHQTLGLPQQKMKPGSTMVFHASKTSVFVGPLNSYSTKTCATKSTYYLPDQKMDPFSNLAYPSKQHSTISPFQLIPSEELLDDSVDDALSSLNQHPDPLFLYPPAEDTGIDPVLEDEILVVLLQQPQGVDFGEFAGLFHRTHGYQLKICRHGFTSLRALLDEMADLVTVSADPHNPRIKCKGRHHYVFIGGGPFSSRI